MDGNEINAVVSATQGIIVRAIREKLDEKGESIDLSDNAVWAIVGTKGEPVLVKYKRVYDEYGVIMVEYVETGSEHEDDAETFPINAFSVDELCIIYHGLQ